MLKKVIIFFLIFFSIFSSSFAYNPSKNDKKILKKIYVLIDKKYYKQKKVRALYFAIKKVKLKYKNKKSRKKQRIYFLLEEIEKYLENKLNIKQKIVYKKIKNEQDEQIKKEINNSKKLKNKSKKRTKKQKRIVKKIFKKAKKNNKKILKATIKNGVLVKYIKKEKLEKPKHTPKNLTPKIQTKFKVNSILENNKIVINYYGKNTIFEITGLDEIKKDKKNINNLLKKLLENKIVEIDNFKKDGNGNLKAEIYINGENILDKIKK